MIFFISPPESAVVQWFHRGRLMDDDAESSVIHSYFSRRFIASYRLTVHGASKNEVGEYTIVVTRDGRNAADRIILSLPGTYVS